MHEPPRGGETGAPATLEDPLWLATGAMVAALLAHRRDWVRVHAESIELRDGRTARRRVRVEFDLPAVARAEARDAAVATAPLGLLPKSSQANVRVRNAAGADVPQLPEGWSAEIAAAGLVALAKSAGADGGAELRELAWRVAAGTPEQAEEALAELARGESGDARIAWMHGPFRRLAQALADHSMLLVPLAGAEGHRTLEYVYEEHTAPVGRLNGRAEGIYARLAERFAWDGIHASMRLPPLDDADMRTVQAVSDPSVDVALDIDEQETAVEIHAKAPRARAVRLAPLAGVLTAVLLTIAWLVVPRLEDGPGALSLLLAAPAVLAAYVSARPASPAVAHLVRGTRRLLLWSGLLILLAEVVLATGASTAVLRVGTGISALGAWVVAALLIETRRRALGGRRPPLPQWAERPVRKPKLERVDASRLALLGLAMAAGLMVVALADNAARDGKGGAHTLFWLGLLAIYAPAVLYVWRARPRNELIAAVVLLGLALYLVKVLHSPLGFTSHDEFSTLRTTLDLDRFGHPFHHNPLIPVHPFYPALELVTSGVSTLTGLSTFTSALVVIGVLRVALMAALFTVFEAAASTRVAALATVLYACNPNFLFFDSQWAYESFALPLALVVIAMVARGRRTTWLAIPIVIALCMSHPLTTMALIAFLLVWAAIDAWLARREGRAARRELWGLALVTGLCMTVWAAFIARSLGGYLGPVIGDAGNSLVNLLLGESGPKRIFGAAGAEQTAVLERLLGFAAVLLSLAALAFGARPLWRRFTALGGALGVAALVYPLSLPLRLTDAGTEISNRASEFVFVGVAFLGGLALTHGSLRRPAWLVRSARWSTAAVAVLAAVAMLGGVVIGTAPSSRLPGRFLVVADERSVEPEGLAAARWTRAELGTGNRIVTDRANGLLTGSLGLQEPQVGEIDGRKVPNVITAPSLDPDVLYTLVSDKIGYLVVDKRLSTALPAVGFYFERQEPGAYQHKHPPSLTALLKYDSVCSVSRIFDSGEIVVYDTRRVAQSSRCSAGVAPPPARGPAQ